MYLQTNLTKLFTGFCEKSVKYYLIGKIAAFAETKG